MRPKRDRERVVQMFMDHHATTSQGAAQFCALELPTALRKAHGVVTCHHPLVLQRENQLEIFASERHEGSATFRSFDREALVELTDVVRTQKLIGGCERGDATQSQFLW